MIGNHVSVGRFVAGLTLAALTATCLTSAPAEGARPLGDGQYEYTHDVGKVGARKAQRQWALGAVNARAAWKISRGDGVTVGLVDSGVGPTWELDGRVARTTNLAGLLTPRIDRWDHGTAVACIIAARPDKPGWRGITGIAPAARIYSARVFGRASASPRVIVQGIRWATRQRVDVLNLSLAMQDRPILRRAIRSALRSGVIVVAGAGNTGGLRVQRPQYPAAYPGVIAVGGVAPDMTPYSATTRGSYVDVAAPAEDVLSCDPFHTLSHYTGTSYASPMVAGVVALMKSVAPGLTAKRAERILRRTAQDLGDPGRDDTFGWGFVDAAAAVKAARRH